MGMEIRRGNKAWDLRQEVVRGLEPAEAQQKQSSKRKQQQARVIRIGVARLAPIAGDSRRQACPLAAWSVEIQGLFINDRTFNLHSPFLIHIHEIKHGG